VPASREELLRVHDAAYVEAVQQAGADPSAWGEAFGIGPGDTPPFAQMHEVSALVCGATIRALEDVVAGRTGRSFSPAGGLHHAHRDRAAGFCVYNDPAVAIAHAIAEHPGLRVAYVDVDVHHGDGVQEAFYRRADVLTVSVHESGRYLYPGTGRLVDIGEDEGSGFALNLPMEPGAGDDSYALAFEGAIAPAVRAFAPDVIVAQLGADTHLADPLAHLHTTVAGQCALTHRLVALADEVCDGRICATGGGGYDSFSAVPRAWACALAELLGVEVPAELPETWRAEALETAERAGVAKRIGHAPFEEPDETGERTWGGDPLGETERAIERLRGQHPLLRG
jgi:acetoin utilization protein AcuC